MGCHEIRRRIWKDGAFFFPAKGIIGFTLLELLVAAAVFALILVFVVTVVSQMGGLSQWGIAKMRSQFGGRVALDHLAEELRRAARPAPGQATNRPRLIIATSESLGTSICKPQALVWFVTEQTAQNAFNLAAVSYFVRWNQFHGTFDPILCRITDEVDAPQSGTVPLKYLDRDAWLTTTFYDDLGPGTEAENFRGLFAERVLALWVRALDRFEQPIVRNASGAATGYAFDSEAGYRDSAGKVFPAPAYPPILEMALVVIDGPGLRRLASEPSEPAAASPDQFQQEIENFTASLPEEVRKAVRVYQRRIPLDQ